MAVASTKAATNGLNENILLLLGWLGGEVYFQSPGGKGRRRREECGCCWILNKDSRPFTRPGMVLYPPRSLWYQTHLRVAEFITNRRL